MSIIKNTEILTSDYVTDKLINRKEQKANIKENVFDPFFKKEFGIPLYIYGSSGTGKTATIKKLMRDYSVLGNKNEIIYINCKNFPFKYSILVNVLNKLNKYLPIQYFDREINKIPLRGWNYSNLLDILQVIIQENNLNVLLILDEIDKPITKDGDDVIYNFLEFPQRLNPERFYFISISNNPHLDSKFSMGVSDRLKGKKLHFPKYNMVDIYQGLQYFANISLKDGSYKDEDLEEIAKKVSESSGSMREAKQILYQLAKNKKDKIDIKDFEKAEDQTRKEMLKEEFLTRPYHQKLTILAIIDAWRKYKEVKTKVPKKYSLNFLPTTNNIFKHYVNECKRYAQDRKSIESLRKYIKELSKDGLIENELRSFGRARGIVNISSLIFEHKYIESILRNSMAL